MANPFDQFDGGQQSSGGNPFDQFDAPVRNPQMSFDGNAEPTFAEKYIAPLLGPMFERAGLGPSGLDARSVLTKGSATAVGAAQLAANLLSPLLPEEKSITSLVTGKSPTLATKVNDWVKQKDQEYQDYKALGGGGTTSEVVGGILDPANALIASRIPMAKSLLGRAASGFGVGAGGAILKPKTSNDYWAETGKDAALGGVLGAVLTPAIGAIADKAIRYLSAPDAAALGANMDDALNAALKESGQTLADVPPQQLSALRQTVSEALQSGKQYDPSQMLRKADFEALGMKPTLGQITRDPMQFAQEQNLRGVVNVGEPLTARFAEQGNQLQAKLAAPAAGAADAYNAGTTLTKSLSNLDENVLSPHVTALYNQARQSAGKDLELPLQGLAQDYAQILGDFGDKVPGAIRSKFAALGLDPAQPSNQKQLFTIEDADKLLKVINAHVGNDVATNRALGNLRSAVKATVTTADASGGPFAPAVKAASERFKMMEAIPALKAASEGSVAPDDFVRRFIMNGKTDDVKGLSEVLKASDPQAWQEARAQIGDALKRAAFGENMTGDAPFRAASYMEQIRRLGVDKLGAFFNAQEVDDILRVGRVGALIKQTPNASAVNTSNSGSAVGNLFGRIPGAGPAAAIAGKAIGTIQNNNRVKNALAAQLTGTDAPLSDGQQNILRMLLASGAFGAGGLAGQ